MLGRKCEWLLMSKWVNGMCRRVRGAEVTKAPPGLKTPKVLKSDFVSTMCGSLPHSLTHLRLCKGWISSWLEFDQGRGKSQIFQGISNGMAGPSRV